MVDTPGCKLAWFQVTAYASTEHFVLKWKWLYVEVEVEEAPDDDFLDTDSSEYPPQRDAGCTQDGNGFDPGMTTA